MHPRGEAVIGVERGQYAGVVAGREKLLGERLDMPRHSTRVRPRIGRTERNPHLRDCTVVGGRGYARHGVREGLI
ncbi:MAG: hypothetical protein NVSMB51_18450 [Solirubrobacteraceae bacterium]